MIRLNDNHSPGPVIRDVSWFLSLKREVNQQMALFAKLSAIGIDILCYFRHSLLIRAIINIKSEMRSFKSNENIHKKEGGSYYVVSANKASSVTL